MNYDEMEAGDEMNVLVAEHVCGWIWWFNVKSERRALFPPEATGVGRDGEWVKADGSEEPYSGRPGWILDYSTNIAHAWEVVEKLRHTHLFEYEGAGVSVWAGFQPFGADKTLEPDDGCYSESAPLAICRAALKAL